MHMRRFSIFVGAVAMCWVALGKGGRADIVDGNWCSGDGRRLSIVGEDVSTPGGTKLKAEYGRHHVLYKQPLFEMYGGRIVDIVLVSPDVIHVRYLKGPTEYDEVPAEEWTRCKEPLSQLSQ